MGPSAVRQPTKLNYRSPGDNTRVLPGGRAVLPQTRSGKACTLGKPRNTPPLLFSYLAPPPSASINDLF